MYIFATRIYNDMKVAKIIVPGRYSAFVSLNRLLNRPEYAKAQCFIFVDENSYAHCLSPLIAHVERLQEASFCEVPVGEDAKTVEVATQLWSTLHECEADSNVVIVNLGGGCVSDLGGFVASTYRRGVRYINVPTTLLGMVDAAIGGKTALNLDGVKNQVGCFFQPDAVVIEPMFLQTLPEAELKNGLLEMMKTLLLSDRDGYYAMCELVCQSCGATPPCYEAAVLNLPAEWIYLCAQFKNDVVKADPNDHGIRHILNFGHTFGHAIEAYSHEQGAPFSHGIAVGLGMACAMYLSVRKMGFPVEEWKRYKAMLSCFVPLPRYTLKDTETLLAYMRCDKKNANGQILCVLLQDIVVPVIDVEVDENEIRDALLKLGK